MNTVLPTTVRFLAAWWRGITVAVVVLALSVCAWHVFRFPEPDTDSYQAVFLTNGQAYFGKLTQQTFEYVRLDDVYYLVANPQSNDSKEAERAQKSQLVKLGGEVHAPQGYMYIPKKQILFWEDLSPTSRIIEAMRAQ